MADLPDKELLRADEVADYLSVSVRTIYGWIDQGLLGAVRVGPTRILRVPRENVAKIIKSAQAT